MDPAKNKRDYREDAKDEDIISEDVKVELEKALAEFRRVTKRERESR